MAAAKTLVYLIPALLTAGGVIWEWLKPERDPEWADKAVFNDRMRQLHAQILNVNTALAQCKAFMKRKTDLDAWRTYKANWAKYYAEVGRLDYLGPNQAQIANAKLYSGQLVQWIQLLQSIKDCAPVSDPLAPHPPSPSPGTQIDWVQIAGFVGVGWLVSRLLFGRG